MTTFDYAELQGIAAELLAEFGRSVLVKRVSGGTYNPDTGTESGVTSTSHARNGAMFDFPPKQSSINNTLIQRGDKRMLIDTAPSPLLMTDRIVAGGVEYGIISIGEVNPAGVAVIYDLQLRK